MIPEVDAYTYGVMCAGTGHKASGEPAAKKNVLWHIPKPRYMRWVKYDTLMEEYRRLQKEYESLYYESLRKAFEQMKKLLS